ncbi:MAG: hypothetical protein AAGU05_06235 [Anaerolineaceae bacterium]
MNRTMINKEKKPALTFRFLYILLVLLSAGAVISGALMMISPDGGIMHMPLRMLNGSPFGSFFIPGLILFTFLGVFPALIAYGMQKKPVWAWAEWFNPFKRYHWSWAGSMAAGIIVIIWLTVELVWVGFSGLLALYYVWGGLIIVLALLPGVRMTFRR